MQRLFLFCLFLITSQLKAFPTGFQPKKGQVEIVSKDARSMVMESSRNSVVYWEDFNIGRKECMTIRQPDEFSTMLNRVPSEKVSFILGRLESNGKIVLINPSGVMVGSFGVVETAGFIASSLDISEEDLFKGQEMLFLGGDEGRVVNWGHIKCPGGSVALFSRTVENEGLIESERAYLATGSEILLKPVEGREHIFVRAGVIEDEGIDQLGIIRALQTELKTSAPHSLAVRHRGTIDASTVREEAGRVYLVADYGQVILNGAINCPGGDVTVLGHKIAVDSDTNVTVSHKEKAGKITLGGSFLGEDFSVLSADKVYVSAGAQFNADGEKGGAVTFWSGDELIHNGYVSATGRLKGGSVSIESSGKLKIRRHPNLLAHSGDHGVFYTKDQSLSPYVQKQLRYGHVTVLGDDVIELGSDIDFSWKERGTLTLKSPVGVNVKEGARLRSFGEGALCFEGERIQISGETTYIKSEGSFNAPFVTIEGGSRVEGLTYGGCERILVSGERTLLRNSCVDSKHLIVSDGAEFMAKNCHVESLTLTGASFEAREISCPEISLRSGARLSTTRSLATESFEIGEGARLQLAGQLTTEGDLRVLGGGGIKLAKEDVEFVIGGDLLVEGFIGSDSGDASSSMFFRSVEGEVQLVGGSIGHRNTSKRGAHLSGDIIFDEVAGSITLNSAQIGHVDTSGFGTLSGNITVNADEDINIFGAETFARIGHGKVGVKADYLDGSEVLAIAGHNMTLASTPKKGQAELVNHGGSLTLVVENTYRDTPDFGDGALVIGSLVAARDQLRIYSVQPESNKIKARINGESFEVTPFGINSDFVQWDTYFPEGEYISGAPFVFYFKVGPRTYYALQNPPFVGLQTALAQLDDLLPNFKYMRLPIYPDHHGSFCYRRSCDPDFSPYGSFVFEDDVYWIK